MKRVSNLAYLPIPRQAFLSTPADPRFRATHTQVTPVRHSRRADPTQVENLKTLEMIQVNVLVISAC